MEKIAIVTDSTSALSAEVCEEHGIGVVPVGFTVNGRSFMDGELTENEFIEHLRPGMQTNAPSPGIFMTYYEEATSKGASEIIVPLLSKEASTTFENARQAARWFTEEHSGVKVHVVDSGFVSLGLGWQALTAARMARSGSSARSILEALEDQKSRTVLYVLLDKLLYAYKGGRINHAEYEVGEFAHIKGIARMREGKVVRVKNVPLMLFALQALTHLILARAPYEFATVSSQTGDPNGATLAKRLKAKGVELSPDHVPLPTTVLIHSGPGAVGFVGVSAK